MGDVQWIKLATSVFDNRKIRQIERMPEGDSIIVVWFKLLCLAGTCNKNGMIYLTEEIPFTEDMLVTEFHMENRVMTLRLALQTFQKFGMMEIINDVLYISSWDKYQNTQGLEKIREQNRIRQARFKESKKLLQDNVSSNVTNNVTSNAEITLGNATEKEIEIDKELDINNKKTYMCAFESFWSTYPRKKEKAKAYKCYQSRLKDGYTDNELYYAAVAYSNECKKNKTEERFIKLAATFLGPNTPFIDYLEREVHTDGSESNKQNESDPLDIVEIVRRKQMQDLQ